MKNEQNFQVLQRIAQRLNAANVIWAVGGSMLLYFKGITSVFRDIDIMVKTEDADRVRGVLGGMGTIEVSRPSTKFKSKVFLELTIDGVDVDVMAGFVIMKDGIAHDCALREDEIMESIQLGDQTVPLHSLKAWRRNYELMGKPEKVRMIDAATR